MSVSAYFAHTRIQIREDMRYFWSDAIWNGVVTAMYAGLLIVFYQTAGTAPLAGFSWPIVVWYVFAAQFASAPSSMFVRTLTLQIRSGEVISRISRPNNFIGASFAEHIGTVIPSSLARLAVIIPLGLILVGPASLSLTGTLFFTLMFVLAITLDFFISLCLGVIGFWTEDARPYRWIYNKTVFLIGGLFFPLEIYPVALRKIVVWMPPAFLAYHPALVLVQPTREHILVAMLGAIAWIAVFVLLGILVFRKAVRRLEVNGG